MNSNISILLLLTSVIQCVVWLGSVIYIILDLNDRPVIFKSWKQFLLWMTPLYWLYYLVRNIIRELKVGTFIKNAKALPWDK